MVEKEKLAPKGKIAEGLQMTARKLAVSSSGEVDQFQFKNVGADLAG